MAPVSDTQRRRTAEGRCRECGDPINRPATKKGEKPVYCLECVTERKEKEKFKRDVHRKSINDMRRALGMPPLEDA